VFIKNVRLKNFRNYKDEKIEFSKGVNVIYGKNAQGKTNLVESLYLLSCAKSFKTSKDTDLIMYGESNAIVSSDIARNYGDINIKCDIRVLDSKVFYKNNNKLSKTSEIFGNLCVIFFSPDEIFLIKGAPSDRREFMDTDISQISSVYYELLNRFEKVLTNRNKLLKTHDEKLIEQSLDVWDEQFATYAAKIIITRKRFIEKLKGPANDNLNYLTDNSEVLTIEYDGESGESEQEIKHNILKSLERTKKASIEVGYTLIGPQRDDIIIKINGNDLKNFGSQGQIRSVVLALKLAELEIFEQVLKDRPVLVLDDVFSELDTKRRNKLIKKIKDCQTIITCVNNKFGTVKDFHYIKINEGRQI